ncbi:hypothetical protein H4S14_003868 [Agrobacterium vitis]|nr:hypothetical protein [Agrobacterium vitis]MBE1440097.1 hypothetical protein [Agrobacterium vitis]
MAHIVRTERLKAVRTVVLSGLLASTGFLCLPSASMALSELQGGVKAAAPAATAPAQTPAAPAKDAAPTASEPSLSNPEDTNKVTATDTKQGTLEVMYDVNKAPEPVRKLREKLVDAASSGDPEKLRALLSEGAEPTALALGSDNGDPIATIKSVSGDPDGIEVLAIMMDVLNAGFVHVNAGTPDEAYVWPYFAEKPLNTLTAKEKVELLRIVTAGDYENMLDAGNYNFFRIGIAPDGKWKFFTAGD